MSSTTSISAQVQTRLGLFLRDKVAGSDAPARAEEIWGAKGERWFTPDDPIWRVNADAAMFPGGIASLLMQMLHPLAMAGVAGHSGYRSDPWGRLQRTSHYIASTTFGTVDTAEAAIAKVRDIHTRVRGKDTQGRPYSASDPHLLTWVHLAEVKMFLHAFQTYGAQPLSAPEADLYVAQAARSARLLGVPEPPQTVRELDAQLADYRSELEVTSEARQAARFLLFNPPVPLPLRPGYGVVAAGGVGLLPDWSRRMLRLYIPEFAAGAVVKPIGRAGTSTIRWAMSALR